MPALTASSLHDHTTGRLSASCTMIGPHDAAPRWYNCSDRSGKRSAAHSMMKPSLIKNFHYQNPSPQQLQP
jgi:hypothetical protein